MKGKDLLKKFLAGVFFVLCILLITTVVFVIGVEKGFTEPKFQMTALFREVGGLAEGAPVRLSGVTVGTVYIIDFLDKEKNGRGVRVIMSLFERYRRQLYKSAKVAIITEGILGEKIIEIKTAPDFWRKDLNEVIIGEDPLDVQNLAETFGEAAVALLEAGKAIDLVIADVQKISFELKDISIETRRLMQRIEQRVIEGNLFKVF